jgi:hypothetical protein
LPYESEDSIGLALKKLSPLVFIAEVTTVFEVSLRCEETVKVADPRPAVVNVLGGIQDTPAVSRKSRMVFSNPLIVKLAVPPPSRVNPLGRLVAVSVPWLTLTTTVCELVVEVPRTSPSKSSVLLAAVRT